VICFACSTDGNTQCRGNPCLTCKLHNIICERRSSPWPSPTKHSTANMQNSVSILSSWGRERSDRLIALAKVLDRCPESVAAELHRLAESSGNVDLRLALSEEEGSGPLPIAADEFSPEPLNESSPEPLDGQCYRCSALDNSSCTNHSDGSCWWCEDAGVECERPAQPWPKSSRVSSWSPRQIAVVQQHISDIVHPDGKTLRRTSWSLDLLITVSKQTDISRVPLSWSRRHFTWKRHRLNILDTASSRPYLPSTLRMARVG
jgi:hypothetical protein